MSFSELNFFYSKEKSNAIVFPSKIVGGHEIMALSIIESIIKKDPAAKDKIALYFPEENTALLGKVQEMGLTHTAYASKHRKLEVLHAFSNPVFLNEKIKLLKKIKDKNIILVQGDIQQGSGFIVAAKLASIKVRSYLPFAHSYKKMNSPGHIVKDPLANICYKLCDDYITISDCFVRDIQVYNKNANVAVINNFVSAPSKKRSENKEFGKDGVNIFIIGRVQFIQKGHDILVSALSEILSEKINLHIIGDGPDLDELKGMVKALPSNISVTFYGWQNDCWEFALDADAIVIPSRYEGVPLIMLEAMIREVPIIAVARDGMVDYLTDESLYYPEDNEVLALRNKITSFISNHKNKL